MGRLAEKPVSCVTTGLPLARYEMKVEGYGYRWLRDTKGGWDPALALFRLCPGVRAQVDLAGLRLGDVGVDLGRGRA